ncbi:alpha/beta hydrolase [Flavobacterium sp. NRK F10]|uniref:alpha/beta fold hydrolase n=1 Tax=Flavobacterium sp. NRK F10 TaxID=2954931 RepID=UPI0020914C38|nr:alpha/beta hydrolase [Flavobacterium sp. NRK F10]MCO6174593.1 alpha/beta hydrolase [Flavobacterium sp. NRK F10]
MKKTHYKNASIAYSDKGSGNAVVLLHGFLENQKMWRHLEPLLKEQYRVINIDLLGHGQSDSLGYVHAMEDMADVVFHVLRESGIKEAVFIGHSMGGYAALAIAELYPEAVKGIVLLNSTSKEDSEIKKKNRDRAIKVFKKNHIAAINMAITNLFSEENQTTMQAEIEQVKKDAINTPLQGIIATQEGIKNRKDREFILHQSDFPKLLILGNNDPVLNYEESLKQAEGTNTKVVSLHGGHMSHLENKKETTHEILSFLKTCFN